MEGTALQAVATNIVVISVALLAVTFFIFSAAWQGLLQYLGLLSVQGRRAISNPISSLYLASFAIFGSIIAIYYVGHEVMQIIVFFGMLLLAAIGILYSAFRFVWNLLLHQKLPSVQRPKEPDSEEWEKLGMLFYSTSVVNLSVATLSFAFCVFGATDTTVGTGLRPDPADDIDFSGWLLYAGTTAFLLGLLFLGAGKYVDLYLFVGSKRKGEAAPDSASQDDRPADPDEA